jgi:hypothetical protein
MRFLSPATRFLYLVLHAQIVPHPALQPLPCRLVAVVALQKPAVVLYLGAGVASESLNNKDAEIR